MQLIQKNKGHLENKTTNMKQHLYLIILLLFCFSCEKEDSDNEFIIKIKDSKVNCSGYEGQTECYLVQRGNLIGTQQWEYFYEQIEGFNYQSGFIYTLKVKSVKVENPPMDAPWIKYFLIKELSKE